MDTVTLDGGEFGVDASIIAEGLGLDPSQVLTAMRELRLTGMCERGIDEDLGRSQLTFFYGRRRLRLVIDEAGTILERSVEHANGREGTHPRGASPFPSK
jgi:hypothetical protein